MARDRGGQVPMVTGPARVISEAWGTAPRVSPAGDDTVARASRATGNPVAQVSRA